MAIRRDVGDSIRTQIRASEAHLALVNVVISARVGPANHHHLELQNAQKNNSKSRRTGKTDLAALAVDHFVADWRLQVGLVLLDPRGEVVGLRVRGGIDRRKLALLAFALRHVHKRRWI